MLISSVLQEVWIHKWAANTGVSKYFWPTLSVSLLFSSRNLDRLQLAPKQCYLQKFLQNVP